MRNVLIDFHGRRHACHHPGVGFGCRRALPGDHDGPSTTPSVTTATFTALQPRGTTHQFNDVWRHEFTVTVNADGTFEGVGDTFDNDGSTVIWAETITGSFNADRSRSASRRCPSVAARRSR